MSRIDKPTLKCGLRPKYWSKFYTLLGTKKYDTNDGSEIDSHGMAGDKQRYAIAKTTLC